MDDHGYQNINRDDDWEVQAQYQPYEEPQKEPSERKEGHGNTRRMLTRYAALALVFGLIAGTAFKGATYFFGRILDTKEEVTQEKEGTPVLNRAENSDANINSIPVSTEESAAITDVSGIAENVMPAIVAITNVAQGSYPSWFGRMQEYESEQAGSGIIVTQDKDYLYIATNNHVVANTTSLTVQFCNNSTVSAEVKGTDSGNDLAVLAVKLADIEDETMGAIKVATIGSSKDLRVGEAAVAIGNALGYGQSVTTGVISALNREVSVEDDNGQVITNELIQTDAAINPGNSGGALLNIRGEVIGINSVKYSDTDVEGMGYAIPMDTASPIIEKLIRRELVDKSQTPYLGVRGVDVSDSVAGTYNMPEGVYVYQIIDGSPAQEAGIAQGDIITKFDGSKITSKEDLEEQMQYCAAGSEIELTIQRLSNEENGKYVEQQIVVTLGYKN